MTTSRLDDPVIDQEIIGQYLDNSGYDVNASIAEAGLFVIACRKFLILPREVQAGLYQKYALSSELINDQLLQARNWIKSQQGKANAGKIRHIDNRGFRR